MNHFARATVLGLLVGSLLALFFLTVDLTPMQASAEAAELDILFRTYGAIAGMIFGVVVVFVGYSIVAFRRRRPDERGAAFRQSPLLERGWLIVTTLLVLGSAIDAAIVLDKIFAPRTGYAQEELEVKVTAAQWSWTFDYPQYGVRSGELVLEKDRPVLFRLYSRDVVHSFFVPEFRMKFDTVPGMETQMRVVPTVVGNYQAPCAELCGLAHTTMAAPVRVVETSGFQQWLAEQKK
ncbi:MAG: cytochrome c oxidase subunit II [Chloroflexi bacterium]|nr:cytochrome c oxidase subunit II [Chloroflexota bacterium]